MTTLNTYLTNDQIQSLINDSQIDNGDVQVFDKIEATNRNYYLLDNDDIIVAPHSADAYACPNGIETLDGNFLGWKELKENPNAEIV